MTIKLNLSINEANTLIDGLNLSTHVGSPEFNRKALQLVQRIELAVEKKQKPQRIEDEEWRDRRAPRSPRVPASLGRLYEEVSV